MANIVVGPNDDTLFVTTSNRAVTVTVDLTGVDFSIYLDILRGGVKVGEFKAVRLQQLSFDVLKNDTVRAEACGAGTVKVTVN